MHLYGSMDTNTAWKNLRFILSVRSDFHITDRLLIAVHAFASRVLMSVSIDETLLLKGRWTCPLDLERYDFCGHVASLIKAYEYISKWLGPQQDLFSYSFFLLINVFLVSFHCLLRVVTIAGGFAFDLMSGDRFDRVDDIF